MPFLHPAGDVQLPGVVPEIALELAVDGRHGVRQEGVAAAGVEAVDRLDQAEARHLVEVLAALGRAAVAPGDPAGHGQEGDDRRLAQPVALGTLGAAGHPVHEVLLRGALR